MNKKIFMEAVKDSFGILTTIAARIGCNRTTIYNFLEKYPDMKKVLEDEKERIIDRVEKKLFFRAIEGDIKAIDRVLRSKKAQERGYGDYSEVKHTGEMTQNINKIEVEIIETKKDE